MAQAKILGTVLAGLMAAAGLEAAAQDDFPNRTIRVIVPFAAGGGADAAARLVSAGLAEVLGQTVLVENHPGGSNMIGTQIVVSSPPDGYTLLLGTPTLTINPALLGDELPYDTFADLEPVSMLSMMPYVIVVRPSLGVATLEELIALAEERPGELTLGSPGIASGGHLAMELFQQTAGVELLHVPYTGTAPATMDLIGERIDMQFAPINTIRPHIEAGSVVPLAVTTLTRAPSLPDIPTASELLPGFQTSAWNSLLVRSGTPDSVIATLNAAINEVVYNATVAAAFESDGAVPSAGTPEEMLEFLLEEAETFRLVIERAGIEAE